MTLGGRHLNGSRQVKTLSGSWFEAIGTAIYYAPFASWRETESFKPQLVYPVTVHYTVGCACFDALARQWRIIAAESSHP